MTFHLLNILGRILPFDELHHFSDGYTGIPSTSLSLILLCLLVLIGLSTHQQSFCLKGI